MIDRYQYKDYFSRVLTFPPFPRPPNRKAARIVELQRLESGLRSLHALRLTFPTDDVYGKNCLCHLASEI